MTRKGKSFAALQHLQRGCLSVKCQKLRKSLVQARKTKVVGPTLEATLARPQFSSSAPISVSHPQLCKEWHKEKNFFTPDDYTYGSGEKVWWRCKKGPDHVWKAAICERIGGGTGCPCCDGKQVSVTNSLKTLFPKIAKEWHVKKNGKLTPADVTAQANRWFWWQCSAKAEHIWKARVANRTSLSSGCPYCAGKITTPESSLRYTHPDLAKQWHREKNGVLRPIDVSAQSNKRVWWKCKRGADHEWQTKVQDRVNNHSGCPFCAGKKACSTNSLAVLFPEIAKEWHPTRNKKLTPHDVTRGSMKRAWWRCSKDPSHEWVTLVFSRGAKKSGCPFCRSLKVCKSNSLATTRPELASQWHPVRNKNLTPDDVTRGSTKKVWWLCPIDPSHEWESAVGNRGSNGRGCPYCTGRQTCSSNSLASLRPDIAKEWHKSKNGSLTAKDVTTGSNKSLWWICSKDKKHQWQAKIITRCLSNTGCPHCWRMRQAGE